MLPMQFVRLELGELLVNDATTLAPVVANKTALVTSNVVPDENLAAGDLTYATFTGSTPLAGAAGAQDAGVDPATGEQVCTILAPVGGWRWECTVAPASPETIYGFALLDTTLTTLIGYALLPTPVTIATVGDFIDLGSIEMRFVLQPLS